MEITENRIEVRRTGVYFQAGDPNTASSIWMLCHGYGQLANNLLRRFDQLIEKGVSVTSVEGLNRFYWQGVTGQTAATWMTKRFRLDEIKANNDFLSQVHQKVKNEDAKNVLLGFSQGGTTLWRWIHDKQPEFDVFINYAGWMPEDIDLTSLQDYLSNKKLIFIYGSNDEYLTPDRIDAFHQVLSKSKLNVEIIKTNGEHKVDRETLDEVYEKYIR